MLYECNALGVSKPNPHERSYAFVGGAARVALTKAIRLAAMEAESHLAYATFSGLRLRVLYFFFSYKKVMIIDWRLEVRITGLGPDLIPDPSNIQKKSSFLRRSFLGRQRQNSVRTSTIKELIKRAICSSRAAKNYRFLYLCDKLKAHFTN